MKKLLLAALFTISVLQLGCKKKAANQLDLAEPYKSSEGSVGFDLKRITGEGNSGEWLATYSSQGKVTKFRLQVDPQQASSAGISFGKGRFLPSDGSDSTPLIGALKVALEAKTIPTNVKREKELPFTTAILGEHMSQINGGGFSGKVPGRWVAMKIFVEDPNGEASEVFLNYNPAANKAEFSIKDSDYGDALIAHFATVF